MNRRCFSKKLCGPVLVAGLLVLTLASIAAARSKPSPQNPSQQPDVFNSQGQPQAPLQGGVSVNQPLNTSPMHISQLVLSIGHDVGVLGEAATVGYEKAVVADLQEFAALEGVSDVAQRYAPCVQQYETANAHFLKAANLNTEYTRDRDSHSASSQTLNAINRQMNQESNAGSASFKAAQNCVGQVTQQQADVFKSQSNVVPPVIPPPPSRVNPQSSLPKPACASYAPRGFGRDVEMWNKWKYDVTATVAQNFSAGSLGYGQGQSPYVSADFQIHQDGTISIVEIRNVSGGDGPQDLIAAVQRAILALSGHMTFLAFPDQRSPVVQLNIIRDPWGCFQPGGYYQLAEGEGVGHGGGSVSGVSSAGGAEAACGGNGGADDSSDQSGYNPATGRFELGANATDQNPVLVTPVSPQQAFKLKTGKHWIDWDPFFQALGQREYSFWKQLNVNGAAAYDTASFRVNKNGTISEITAYGAQAPSIENLIAAVQPPSFPLGSRICTGVVIKQDFKFLQQSGSSWTRTVGYFEVDGKLYSYPKIQTTK